MIILTVKMWKKKKERTGEFRHITLLFNIAIEAVPLDLQRNFTLMRELDGYAQGSFIFY